MQCSAVPPQEARRWEQVTEEQRQERTGEENVQCDGLKLILHCRDRVRRRERGEHSNMIAVDSGRIAVTIAAEVRNVDTSVCNSDADRLTEMALLASGR